MKTIIFQQTEEVTRRLKEGESGLHISPYGYFIVTQKHDALSDKYFPGTLKVIETPREADELTYGFYYGICGSCGENVSIPIPHPKVKKWKWKIQMSSGVWVIADLPPSAEPSTTLSCWEKVLGSEVEE